MSLWFVDGAGKFWSDGYCVVRNMVTHSSLTTLREEIDAHLRTASDVVTDVTARNNGPGGRFAYGHSLVARRPPVRAVLDSSGLSAAVAAVLEEREHVFLLDDQAYAKAPKTADEMPWHQDASFWPLTGRRLCTAWLALDRVTNASGGLELVVGSHAWGRVYRAHGPVAGTSLADPAHLPLPTDAELRRHEVVSPRLLPGDAIIFHGLTLHRSGPNVTTEHRRAFVTRWAGSDVVYAPRDFGAPRQAARARASGATPGERLDAADFDRFRA